jgi:hypothetical protein
MPKILINEVDKTSAGTPGRYGNYSVLLAGYKGTPNTDETKWQKPDENGVYEFSSAQAFKDTIGEAGVVRKDAKGEATEYHYGNKMAYELLKLGYDVVYKVIDNVAEMADENFWAIFKDKASYDFRFISHGLLETCYDAAKHSEYYSRLIAIDEALAKLAEIEAKAAADVTEDNTIIYLEQCQKYFENLAVNYKGFVNNAGAAYSSYILAAGVDGSDATGETLTGTGLPQDRATIQAYIDEHNAKHLTVDVFNQINGNIARLASYRVDEATGDPFNDGRGDCVALIELDEDIYCETGSKERPETLIVNGINGTDKIKGLSESIGEEGAYCALTVPSVYYSGGLKLPGAFHYLACFMNSLSSGFAEWYAAAGYNRGVSSYVIDHTSVKLGEIAINALEPRNLKADPNKVQPKFACNVIANFRGSYYLWGNRTAATLGSYEGGDDLRAEHFLNIRQLCSTIKKQLYVACRRFTFDPNSDTLWFNFVNAITPTLDAMKADQGIRDYKIVKVFTDKKATLKAKIRVIPIEAVEDFDITVSLEDSFGGVSVTAEG